MAFQPRSLPPTRFETVEYKKPKTYGRIAVFDTETDPFAVGASIKPFTCGFYDGETYIDFWGDDCIYQFAEYLKSRRGDKLIIYCHNLGGFDIHFMYELFDPGIKPLIINGRIARIWCLGHEFRDSFKIIPAPLRDYKKDDFDYNKNLRENRETYREEIRKYQKHDCLYLYDLVSEFHETFGNRITIGNAAINMLKHFYGFHTLNQRQDADLRPFFYGGRCENFETGVMEDDWKVYDVNSMYPFVMSSFKHPIAGVYRGGKAINENTYFIQLEAWNNGCLPQRGGEGELDFTCKFGTFFCTIHELLAGLEMGDVKIKKIIRTIDFMQATDFSLFIDHFYQLRLKAKADGDKIRDLFYKLILNNAYGKFAQNPERYEDYFITTGQTDFPPDGLFHSEENPNGWRPKYDRGHVHIWARNDPRRKPNYFNVATGASITGAARSVLYRGIRSAERVAYCDTDSLICRSLDARLDQASLGAWKLEAEGSRLAIAGKKLYALFDDKGNVVKQASKGAKLTGEEIERVALGEVIEYHHDRPTFFLDKEPEYLVRKIERTGK